MLGEKIKHYMDSNGITQAFVSRKTEIPQPILNAILKDTRKIVAQEYFAICKALKVPLDTFVNDKAS